MHTFPAPPSMRQNPEPLVLCLPVDNTGADFRSGACAGTLDMGPEADRGYTPAQGAS